MKHSPPESALPADEIGHITFGCFTALPKINDPLLELWAEILRAVPDSRLRLKNKALGEASVRRRIEAVPMVTLDSCVLRYEWSDIDFMKIDAEGEDANIIGGGKRFFEELSPLIQYEIKAEEPPNMLLLQDFAGRKSRNSSEFPRFSP